MEPVADRDDLYSMTPPAYTQSIADGERSVDGEATRQEKPEVFERSPERNVQRAQSSVPVSPVVSQQQTQAGETEPLIQHNAPARAPAPPPLISHYLTEPVTTADLVGVRACSILHDRPAIWLMKRKSMALSPLAAAVLTQEGLVRPKDLELLV